jgi:hypothetical protein
MTEPHKRGLDYHSAFTTQASIEQQCKLLSLEGLKMWGV